MTTINSSTRDPSLLQIKIEAKGAKITNIVTIFSDYRTLRIIIIFLTLRRIKFDFARCFKLF